MGKTAENAKLISRKIVESKFSKAQVCFCAGSIVRGEGTETSAIDLVVVFPHLEKAWRESFLFEGWPVEAFVHDPATLNYFFQEVDAKSGVPSLPQMVVEGLVAWGENATANELKLAAKKIIEAGPAPLSADDIRNRIYGISDLIDDLKAPRSRAEAVGIGVRLYDSLGDFILRSQGHWSGDGKQISRALLKHLPNMHADFVQAFENFFAENNSNWVIQLAEKAVNPFGGLIFNGYKREAPASWRLPESEDHK